MAEEFTLEERVARLEAAVAELQRRLNGLSPAPSWIEQISGLMKDEPAFEEVLAYGRAIRAADRPLEPDADEE